MGALNEAAKLMSPAKNSRERETEQKMDLEVVWYSKSNAPITPTTTIPATPEYVS